MANEYLAHFGIRGMKWGIRRFQNRNGSLTSAGRQRYYSERNNDSFVLEKGTKTYRIANKDESTSGNKYMSVFEEDRNTYLTDMFKGLKYDRTKEVGEYTNELTRDIKVKTGSSVIKDLIDKYGKDKSEDLMKSLNDMNEMSSIYLDKDSRSNYIDFGIDEAETDEEFDTWARYDSSWDKLNDYVWDVMREHGDEILKDYKDSGYDAIVDPYDYISNVADMPLIVLDPESSTYKTSYRKIA